MSEVGMSKTMQPLKAVELLLNVLRGRGGGGDF